MEKYDYLKRKWHKLGTWNALPFAVTYWFAKDFLDAMKEITSIAPRGLNHFDNGQNHQFFADEDAQKMFSYVDNNLGDEYFSNLLSLLEKATNDIKEAREKAKTLNTFEDFIEYLKLSHKYFSLMPALDWLCCLSEDWYNDSVYEEFNKTVQLPTAEKQEALATLLTSPNFSELQKEQIAILQAAIEIGKPELAKDSELIEELHKKFNYLTVFHHNKPKTKEKYVEEIIIALNSGSLEKLHEQVNDLKNTHEKVKNKQQELLSTLSLPEHLLKRITFLRTCGWIRTRSDENTSWFFQTVQPMFKKLSEHYKIDFYDLHYLLPWEIIKAIQDNQFPSEEVYRRKKLFIAYSDQELDWRILSGQEAEQLVTQLDLIKEEHTIESKEIRGMVACQGKATGKVVICKAGVTGKEFNQGDILVAPMTTIDFVPLMQKAAAIVTDKGGLTCHAAIVSREMGVPCVIGTDIATKVLKDGDIVEVDATNGIVRKITN